MVDTMKDRRVRVVLRNYVFGRRANYVGERDDAQQCPTRSRSELVGVSSPASNSTSSDIDALSWISRSLISAGVPPEARDAIGDVEQLPRHAVAGRLVVGERLVPLSPVRRCRRQHEPAARRRAARR